MARTGENRKQKKMREERVTQEVVHNVFHRGGCSVSMKGLVLFHHSCLSSAVTASIWANLFFAHQFEVTSLRPCPW